MKKTISLFTLAATIAQPLLISRTASANPMPSLFQSIIDSTLESFDRRGPDAPSITVSETNLDALLFGENMDIQRGMISVMAAKQVISRERGRLLPSLSLNAIMIFTNSPQFLVNSVSCLVPFLFPSNWYNFSAAKLSSRAESTTFHIARMNAYATGLALLTHIQGDALILAELSEQEARLQEYVANLKTQSTIGLITNNEILRGELELKRAKDDRSVMTELLTSERAAIAQMLGFEPNQPFEVKVSELAPSYLEGKVTDATPLESVVNDVLDEIEGRAPERRVNTFAIAAAARNASSQTWSFLGGCSGSQGSFGSASNATSEDFSLGTSASVGFGFDYFPNKSIANLTVETAKTKAVDLHRELARSLKVSLGGVKEVGSRLESAQYAMLIAQQMLEEQRQFFDLGRANVKDILEAMASVANSRVSEIAAKTALAGHRITLKRMALEGEFLEIYVRSRKLVEIDKKLELRKKK